MHLSRGPDDGIGQFQPVSAAQCHRPLPDRPVYRHQREIAEEPFRLPHMLGRGAYQHLHPGNRADDPLFEARQLVPSGRDAA
jgi:hypothetical protein